MRLSPALVIVLIGCNPLHAVDEFIAAKDATPPSMVQASGPATLVSNEPASALPVSLSVPVMPVPPTEAPSVANAASTKLPVETQPVPARVPVLAVPKTPIVAVIQTTASAPVGPSTQKADQKASDGHPANPGVARPAYQVRRGETLSGIASANHIPLRELCALNDYTLDDKVPAGVSLELEGNNETWRARRHQSLSQIAETVGVSTAELAAMNGIADPDDLRAGRVLLLPMSH